MITVIIITLLAMIVYNLSSLGQNIQSKDDIEFDEHPYYDLEPKKKRDDGR